MAIKRFSELKKVAADPKQRKAAFVKKIAAKSRQIAKSINQTELTINKAHAAFEDEKRVFTPGKVKKAVVAFDKMGTVLTRHIQSTYTALRAAIAAEIPNDRLANQLEDLYGLKAKLSVLRAQAMGSLGQEFDDEELEEDFVELDESGYVVESEDPVEEIVEEEPMVDEEATEDPVADATAEESTLEQDNDSGFDMTTDKEVEPETHDDNPPERAQEAAPGTPEVENPPDRSLASEEAELDAEAGAAEDVQNLPPDSGQEPLPGPEGNVPTDDHALATAEDLEEEDVEEELIDDISDSVEELEELEEDEMDIELEDSGIDDALAGEILSEEDGFDDIDDSEDEIEATASLKDRRIASSQVTRGNTGLAEDSVLTALMDEEMSL